MRILICGGRQENQGDALEKAIRDQLPGVRILHAHLIKDMVIHLRQPMNHIFVLIVFTPTLDAVDALLQIRSFFEDKKLILVLPSRNNDIFIRAVQLNPSFISTDEGCFDDVLLVLKRIWGRQKTMAQISKVFTYKP